MKALQFLAIIIFIYGFSHLIYRAFLSYDGKPVTPEEKQKLMEEACANNNLVSIDCVNHRNNDIDW